MYSRDLSTRCGLLLLSILTSACGTTDPEISPRIEVRLDPEAIAAGSEMMVTVTVRNEGNTILRFDKDPCMAMRFEVRDPEGDLIYPVGTSPWCFTLGPTERTIRPGSERSVTHRWAAIEGYNSTTGSGEPLPPGLYQVIPIVELRSSVMTGDPVQLEITP